jgi:hypothetical protein
MDKIDADTEFTALTADTKLMIIRPGDVLFVMPIAGEYWSDRSRETIAAIVKERLSGVQVIVLPSAATFETVAVEAREP